jgi:hypothetical protein
LGSGDADHTEAALTLADSPAIQNCQTRRHPAIFISVKGAPPVFWQNFLHFPA